MFFRFFCNKEKVFAITPKEIHGSISLAGYKYKRDNWINQDAFLVESSMTKNDSGDSGDQTLIAAVMDGHGQNGHLVSNYCSTRLIPLLAELESSLSLSDHHSRSCGTYSSSSLEKLFETMHGEVESKMDEKVSNTSGTTMTIVHIANGCIQALNVGDSPVYLGRRKEVNGGLELIQLTLDHKPELDGESKRIKDAGGCVYARPVVDNESNKVELGPMRVWYQCDKKDESKTIGLAMTRSLGDVLAHQVRGKVEDIHLIQHYSSSYESPFTETLISLYIAPSLYYYLAPSMN
jgi:serine/threonine protein phosphatase PrpC